jgi:four helix bundle protein
MYTYSFEKLEVWKDARQLVTWIYTTTSLFPADEKFGLVMQLRRAVVSIVSNLAEGSARTSFKDKAHFSQIAYSSLIEVLNQLIIANDLKFLSNDLLNEGRNKIELLSSKIAGLRNTQLSKLNKPD